MNSRRVRELEQRFKRGCDLSRSNANESFGLFIDSKALLDRPRWVR